MRIFLAILTSASLIACATYDTVDVPTDAGAMLKETSSYDPCGDGRVFDGSDERNECDGDDLAGATCASLGLADGQLACTRGCRFDTSMCIGADLCTNGLLEDVEQCDEGPAPNQLCEYGEENCAVCSADCEWTSGQTEYCGDGRAFHGETVPQSWGREECDQQDFRGVDCQSFGYDGGQLVCTDACEYDRRGCTGQLCGDGLIRGTEECDEGGGNTDRCEYGQRSCMVCTRRCTWEVGETSFCGDGERENIAGREDCELGEERPCSGDNPEAVTCTRACEWDYSQCGTTGSDGGPPSTSEDTGLNSSRADGGCRTATGAPVARVIPLFCLMLLGSVRRR